MSIALDLRAGHSQPSSFDQMMKLLAWVRSVDATTLHVTLRGSIRQPQQRQLQRALLGMGCRITMSM